MKFSQIYLCLLILVLITISSPGVASTNDSSNQNATYTYTPAATKLYVIPGQQVDFHLTASSNGSGVTYSWKATSGIPESGSSVNYSWTAPSIVSSCNVSVTVSKNSAQAATYHWTVEVCNSVNLKLSAISPRGVEKGTTIEVLDTGVGTYKVTTDLTTGVGTIANIPQSSFFLKYSKTSLVTSYIWVDVGKVRSGNFSGGIYSWDDLDTAFGPEIIDHNKAIIYGAVINHSGTKTIEGAEVNISPAKGRVYYTNEIGALDANLQHTTISGRVYIVDLDNGAYTLTASKGTQSFSTFAMNITEPAVYTIYPIHED